LENQKKHFQRKADFIEHKSLDGRRVRCCFACLPAGTLLGMTGLAGVSANR
jgi:hypothetical protein